MPLARQLAVVLVPAIAAAQVPPGYYDGVDTSAPGVLRATLHAVIDDHTKFPYTSGGTDTWVILEQADEDPGQPTSVLDVYKNASYAKVGGGNPDYDREHTWPNSYGFPSDSGSGAYPYTDCHQLFLCDSSYNTSRSNKPYQSCPSGCLEKPTVLTGGVGGGSGVYPGNSNWTSGSGATGTWETWHDRRGDVARALFYLDVRYAGGTHGITGAAEPDLILTDSTALIEASNTGQNEPVAYMGILSTIVQWSAQDPVDAKELARMEVVSSYQGNRNPFVDHPEWIPLLFAPGSAAPVLTADVASLSVLTGGSQVLTLDAGAAHAGSLFFLAGTTEGTVPGFDYAGHHVPLNPFGAYFQLTLAGPGALLAPHIGFLSGTGGANAAFNLPGGLSASLAGTTVSHAYVVLGGTFAVQGASNAMDVLLTAASPGTLVINEIDYDQPATDTAEFIEIYNPGPGSVSLAGTTLELWNGSTGLIYAMHDLSLAGSSLPAGGYLVLGSSTVVAGLPVGTLSITFGVASDNVQNGQPDGLAIRKGASILDSASYEGAMVGITEGTVGAGTDNPAGVMSLARLPNGADTGDNALDIVTTTVLTPGAANL